MNWALVWWKLTSSGGGDADDGVDSALGEPGSGGEFIVVGSQRMGVTLSRALQRVTRQFQIQSSLFSSSCQPPLILNLKLRSKGLELILMNRFLHRLVPCRYPQHIKTAISSDKERRSPTKLCFLQPQTCDNRSLSSRFTR